MRISDWSSDVCSSDLHGRIRQQGRSIADESGKYVRAIGPTPGNQSLAREVCQGRTKFSLRPADAGYAVATASADTLYSHPAPLSAFPWHLMALVRRCLAGSGYVGSASCWERWCPSLYI